MIAPITFTAPYLNQFSNCFVLRTESYNIYIDTALKSSQEALLPYLRENKRQIVLLTHGHWDHIGGNALVREHGGQIWAHRADLPWLSDFKLHWQIGFGQFSEDLPIPPQREETFWREIGVPQPVDRFVQEGDQLVFDSLHLQVIELPGHSRGSVGYYDPESGTLFTGDALMGTGFFGGLAQYCDFDAYCRSMKKLIRLNPQTVYTAHTAPYFNAGAAAAAQEAIVFAEKIRDDTALYARTRTGPIRVGDAARFVCEKEGKKLGCGACICVLNHLAALEGPDCPELEHYIRNM